MLLQPENRLDESQIAEAIQSLPQEELAHLAAANGYMDYVAAVAVAHGIARQQRVDAQASVNDARNYVKFVAQHLQAEVDLSVARAECGSEPLLDSIVYEVFASGVPTFEHWAAELRS